MADTLTGWDKNGTCADCGAKGTSGWHWWGPLVREEDRGARPAFCSDCWKARDEAHQRGEKPKPVGYKKAEAEADWGGFPLGGPVFDRGEP